MASFRDVFEIVNSWRTLPPLRTIGNYSPPLPSPWEECKQPVHIP